MRSWSNTSGDTFFPVFTYVPDLSNGVSESSSLYPAETSVSRWLDFFVLHRRTMRTHHWKHCACVCNTICQQMFAFCYVWIRVSGVCDSKLGPHTRACPCRTQKGVAVISCEAERQEIPPEQEEAEDGERTHAWVVDIDYIVNIDLITQAYLFLFALSEKFYSSLVFLSLRYNCLII